MSTPRERFRARTMYLIRDLQPDISATELKVFRRILDLIPESEIVAALETGSVTAVLALFSDDVMAVAVGPLRSVLTDALRRSAETMIRDIPRARDLGVVFDVLNPRVIEAVRALDDRFVQQLTSDVRATVRQVAERTLRDGINPRESARELRAAIGLGPSQEEQVQNFRRALETGDTSKVMTYTKRDRRFDATIRKGELSPAQVDKMVDIYRKRRIALNAEAVSRTAALNAQRGGQRLAWDSAIDRGIVDKSDLMKERIVTMDGRQRDEHEALNGQRRRYDEAYDNGEIVSGTLSWSCRCLDRYYLAA